MKLKLSILFLFVAGFTMNMNAQIYESPKMAEAKFNHKSMAILPVYVTEKDNSSDAKRQGIKGVVQEDETEGYNLQRSFYTYFITRKPKKVNWTVEIQKYEETNEKLKNAGIEYEEIVNTPKDNLAEILGVDAIFFCHIKKLRTISDGAAVALNFFVGYGGYTGNIEIQTTIYDGSSGEMMWQYKRRLPTSYWGLSDFLVDNIMKATVNKFPYKEKTKKKK